MIIDGKLVVSKKRKVALVQELKEKGFKAFSKVSEALKEGELAPIADNDEEEEEDVEVGAAAYDYLLSMPIWSLTKERVEKLLKQVGDVELAIDVLIKLSKEEIWKRDLNDFIEEWRFQLEDERKSQKKVANMTRRASTKLKIGAGSRKRKGPGDDSDDSDFAGGAGPKTKKPAVSKAEKKPGGILGDYLNVSKTKASPKAKGPSAAAKKALELFKPSETKTENENDIWMHVDGPGDVGPAALKTKAPAPMKKPATVKKPTPDDDESADEEVIRPTVGRKPRAAASKPVKYGGSSDSDSDGDNMLFNVGNMVKGIDTTAANGDTARPLFSSSMSRPGSSAGLSKRPTSSHRQTIDMDADETDYSKLAPPTTKKGPAVTARHTISLDDDNSLDDMPMPITKSSKPKPAPKAATAKAASKPKAGAKKPTPAPEPKKLPFFFFLMGYACYNV